MRHHFHAPTKLGFSCRKSLSRMINVLRQNMRQVAMSKKPVSVPLIGYARVSTQGQDLAQQRAMLRIPTKAATYSNLIPATIPT
jgi:hypothetical protein